MSPLLQLPGRKALSDFRLEKLVSAVCAAVPDVVGIDARFWHFVQVSRPLSTEEQGILARILTYGPRTDDTAQEGDLLLIVPRVGTLSPWSSKATDIARHCGLDAVMRIERGISYKLQTADGLRLDSARRRAIVPLLHDRMTETVLHRYEEAAQLFHGIAPAPLATVDV
ncbi:MAG: phosphoribosylformylglycinamidine synthase, partial [Burkholderiales bacterium]|nr:phosphoribosylformylglycinamidine synthase [Burkholderiales bacterium]